MYKFVFGDGDGDGDGLRRAGVLVEACVVKCIERVLSKFIVYYFSKVYEK